MIVRTEVSKQAEQFMIGKDHYVGRRVLRPEKATAIDGLLMVDTWTDVVANVRFDGGEPVKQVPFRLDYGKGDVFVDPSLLTPFPSEPIPEPSK